ncbi:uncharacterized protein SPPG_02326 [Spizellomyces punctatus DAOM BR117]|uniref:SnoaL-like domain-containing protein n=1 Tax=Spizellomyces punctatus (strain DAOM BR117) TaxID=645134 RepID=A0A0L0HQP6_SPIPD|nr:uncharacterized protein SPPG_02326 [Spizellomyces punctatus DAOM BR117]KND03275.1 hypothetical protein SPPG_02326 [Spizellomyces punctatus DAOM BR117]|eukprot:XP_016611314.1 hypothetical protein SPPG_02326 [Spizellomyces punctatus DAOM BR117]
MTTAKPFDIVAAARKDQLKMRDFYLGLFKGVHSDEVILEAAKTFAPNFKAIYFWGDVVDGAGWIEKTKWMRENCPQDSTQKCIELQYEVVWQTEDHCQLFFKESWGGEGQDGVLVTDSTAVYRRDASKPDGVALLYYQETKVDAETTMKMC